LTDKYIGKKGTGKRDDFENELASPGKGVFDRDWKVDVNVIIS